MSIFCSNLVRRLCGLQSGALDRPVYSVKLSPEARAWTMDALLLTSSLTESYALDQAMEVDFSNIRSFRGQSMRCRLQDGCLFDGAVFSTPAPALSKPHMWDSQKLQAHYLRGAGILWLRDRTISNTGCDLAATMLTSLLQPSEELQAVVDNLSNQLASTGRPTVILNTDRTHMNAENLDAALLSNINGTVWVLGGSAAGTRTLAQRHPHAQILDLSLPEELPPEATSAIMAMVLSFSSHYIGGLDAAWVKIGLLLRLGRYHALPSLSVGDSQWKDDYGFASCTAEEFRVHQRVVSGKLQTEELLALPPQPVLPGSGYVSTRAGWSGRNSGTDLCKNITIPAADDAISVDELLHRGKAVKFDCEQGWCPKVLPMGQEERGSYAFQGPFSEQQRDAEYAGTADHYRCGYMAPSGFDIIRDFPGFHQCKVVVVNLIAKGRDVLLNVQNVGKHNLADPHVCFVSIMDINGLITHQLEPPSDGSLMRYGHWTVVALLNSPWEGTTDVSWLRGARDANVMRHLRFRTFPNAEYSMWVDGKHQIVVDPCTLFDQLLNQKGKAMSVFHHENQRCVFAEQRIIKGLGWTAAIPGYRKQIEDLSARYHKEGMPSEQGGNPQGAYDLAVIVSRHVNVANVHSCLAYSEIESFTSRNQLHFPYTVWRAQAKWLLHEAPNCAAWMYTKHVGHWSDHGGKFQALAAE